VSPAAPAAPAPALREALAAHGARGSVLEELAAYSRVHFSDPGDVPEGDAPLPDEPFVAAWEEYAREAVEVGAWEALRRRLVQLRFPVRAGVGATEGYRAAVRRGEPPPPGAGLALRDPSGLRLWLHPTAAGRIPVVLATERDDFVALVRALTLRNEPVPVPDSMGACIVAGYNNWDRVERLRREWRAENPRAPEEAWRVRFRAIVPRRELYQDRFVLLSSGGYSALAAAELGLDEEAWRRLSRDIRLEHECAHYFTRRVLGSMRGTLHDELLADYAGIRAAAGAFRRDWLLRFLGLERFPAYRSGARLENYRGDPPLSAEAFALLGAMVVRAAEQLERFDARVGDFGDLAVRARVLRALAAVPLPELALPDGAGRVAAGG
jgi:hypothetical protein